MLDRIGRALFRFRTLIGVAAFIFVFVLGEPSLYSLGLGLFVILPGLILRVWAAGHLGRAGRTQNIQAAELVSSGPYRYARNPLYVANFLLVFGTLMALSGPWWSDVAVLVMFVVEYWLVVRAEERALEAQFGEDFRTYHRSVPAIFPRLLYGRRQSHSTALRSFSWIRAAGEFNTLAAAGAVYLLALARIWLASAPGLF